SSLDTFLGDGSSGHWLAGSENMLGIIDGYYTALCKMLRPQPTTYINNPLFRNINGTCYGCPLIGSLYNFFKNIICFLYAKCLSKSQHILLGEIVIFSIN